MEDIIVKMPTMRYPIGEEPVRFFEKINQHSSFKFVNEVQDILGPEQFDRIRRSMLGPVLKFQSNGKMQLSGQLLHCLFTRNLIINKDNELWFHFAGQPMKFSLREFHMVTGLKCSDWSPTESARQQQFDWGTLNNNHTGEDIIELMKNADADANDEKISLGMLVLIESIFLHTYSAAKYPKANLERAQNLEFMMSYAWGKDAYEMLLRSVQKAVTRLDKNNKYDVYGFPLALHVWILESIPKIQSSFSVIDRTLPATTFLIEKYTKFNVGINIQQIEAIEGESYVSKITLSFTYVIR